MFKITARTFFVMVYVEITVLTPSYMCFTKIRSKMYQLYMHLYTKIGDTIMIPEEQSRFKRMYKKLARIGIYLYKLCISHNTLYNECTSGRNSRVKSTRLRASVVCHTRKPRRFRNTRTRWKNKNQVGD